MDAIQFDVIQSQLLLIIECIQGQVNRHEIFTCIRSNQLPCSQFNVARFISNSKQSMLIWRINFNI